MSFELTARVFRAKNLSANQKLVLAALSDHVGSTENPICWPGTATIVEFTSLSKTTVKKILRELRELEFIDWAVRPGPTGKNNTNLYTLNTEALPSLSPRKEDKTMGSPADPTESRPHREPTKMGAPADPEPITKPKNNKNLIQFPMQREEQILCPSVQELHDIWYDHEIQSSLTEAGLVELADLYDTIFRFRQHHERERTLAPAEIWVNLLRGWAWNRAETLAGRRPGGAV